MLIVNRQVFIKDDKWNLSVTTDYAERKLIFNQNGRTILLPFEKAQELLKDLGQLIVEGSIK